MSWQIQIQLNEKLFVRDPASSDVGRSIVKQGAAMIEKMGLEEFTFKKLATKLKTNESSIYRYFENKHRMLVYLVDWYWRWIEYLVVVHINNIKDPNKKIDVILNILMLKVDADLVGGPDMDKQILHQLVIKEASKSYLTSHVAEDNKLQLFKPYKDLCARIAGIFLEINPKYKYGRSLTSTVLEMAHYQYFFMHNLPRLTDFGQAKDEKEIINFLRHLILSSLTAK
ncbi:TetR/AcrR family transcriptional regulator [Chryseolinea sp. H1M3-3]|uniref:TetR/AcrR family transcriptional regulator n=1 Tax=Chryseolinea sp. H1M3-3 TaxID=3034144 RepID=UPI0023ED696E|nr:TetR/AcrR family transcriptional regulator [Chryseolinea sp. H1M3-3]